MASHTLHSFPSLVSSMRPCAGVSCIVLLSFSPDAGNSRSAVHIMVKASGDFEHLSQLPQGSSGSSQSAPEKTELLSCPAQLGATNIHWTSASSSADWKCVKRIFETLRETTKKETVCVCIHTYIYIYKNIYICIYMYIYCIFICVYKFENSIFTYGILWVPYLAVETKEARVKTAGSSSESSFAFWTYSAPMRISRTRYIFLRTLFPP